MSAIDSQSHGELPSAMQQTPKAATAIAMRRPSPSTVVRSTSRTAHTSAPTPVAAMRKPSVWAPPPRVRTASTGVSTE